MNFNIPYDTFQEQIRAEQSDITQQREQLYRKMEVLTSQGLLISPNVALPVTGQLEDSSKDSSEDSSPHSENSGASSCTSTTGIIPSSNTAERRKDSKWNKSERFIDFQLSKMAQSEMQFCI